MEKAHPSAAQQIARAACDFQRQTRGHLPESATVVLSDDTLVITLHGALSPAERALAQNPTGAAQVQNFYRQLFATASDSLRQEIRRITGVEVLDAAAEVQAVNGRLLASGIVVQIFLLGGRLPADGWSGTTGEDIPTPA